MKILMLSILFIIPRLIYTQPVLITTTSSKYSVSQKSLYSKDKKCHIINCIISSNENYSTTGDILILIKIFEPYKRLSINKIPTNTCSLEEFVKKNVIPLLKLDMSLNALTLEPVSRHSSAKIFDSLVLSDGSKNVLLRGVIIIEFFQITSIPRLDLFQSTPTLFNLSADTISIYKWSADSIPTPNISSNPQGKIFLLKKPNDSSFIFFRLPFSCSHCSLSFYNEYLYQKDIGVIAFKSKYLYYYKSNHKGIPSGVYETNEYYYFR